jgi:acetyl esterase/lipase
MRAIDACRKGLLQSDTGGIGLDQLRDSPVRRDVKTKDVRYPSAVPEWREGRGYVTVTTPKRPRATTCILFVHGGGFTSNSPHGPYRAFAAELAARTHYRVFTPDYSLAPEYKYPVQVNEVLALARILRRTHTRVLLVGDSAGGTIGLSAALRRPELFAACAFVSPWVDLAGGTTSYTSRAWCLAQGTGDPVFRLPPKENTASTAKLALEYLGGASLFLDPYANPWHATDRMLSRLPRALIQVGDNEVLRDGVLGLAGRAQAAGAEVTAQLYDGMWHDWPMYSQGCGSGHPLELGLEAYRAIAAFLNGREVRTGDSVEVDVVMGGKTRRRRGAKGASRTRRRARSTSRE